MAVQISLSHNEKNYSVDLNAFFDISIPIGSKEVGVSAWYVGAPTIAPVTDGDFIGSVEAGSSVNFRNISFNPHAHGTHTESMGHISKQVYSVNEYMKNHYFVAELLSIVPQKMGEDSVITLDQVKNGIVDKGVKALIIRTFPNEHGKLTTNYSHTNPTYLEESAAKYLAEIGIEHLLIDTPSVDREEDDGQLKAHKAFWGYPNTDRLHCTITEFVFIPSSVQDGTYFMNLQTAPIENDATPSRPILHHMTLIE